MRGIADIAAAEQYLPSVDVLEQVDAPQQRRFPRTRRPDQHHDFVLADVEIDAVEHGSVVVRLDQTTHRQQGGRHTAPCRVATRPAAQSASRADGTASAMNNRPATTYGVKLYVVAAWI